MNSQKGQVILILILVLTVALSIGLSIVQKSLVDVSTASKVEQSSRAFSAAEAGVEKALKGDTSLQTFTDNSSKITEITPIGLIPATPAAGSPQAALELPPLAKEDVAQVWLADPDQNVKLPDCTADPAKHQPVCYAQDTLDIYWGNSLTDKAAIELTLVYYDGSAYKSSKWYLDHTLASRNTPNGFGVADSCTGSERPQTGTIDYQCRKTLDFLLIKSANPSATWMLIRARLLYNSTSQPFAVQAVGNCATCFLPPQARSVSSTGVSGDTQRKVNIFQLYKVVPPYFDYAIFSAGEIKK